MRTDKLSGVGRTRWRRRVARRDAYSDTLYDVFMKVKSQVTGTVSAELCGARPLANPRKCEGFANSRSAMIQCPHDIEHTIERGAQDAHPDRRQPRHRTRHRQAIFQRRLARHHLFAPSFPENCPWAAGPEDHIQVDLADRRRHRRAPSPRCASASSDGKLHALVNNAGISPKGDRGERLTTLTTDRSTSGSTSSRSISSRRFWLARGPARRADSGARRDRQRHLHRRRARASLRRRRPTRRRRRRSPR